MENYLSIQTERFPSLAYRKYGEGPALVLLHGFPDDGRAWDSIFPSLPGYTIIIPDLPGSGKSAFIGEDITIEQMAESVKAILDAENIEKAILCGHSMGGYTAIAFADLYAQRLKGLSFVHSLAMADTREKKEIRLRSNEIIRKGGKEQFIKQMIPGLFSRMFKEHNTDVIEKYVNRGMQLPAHSMISFYNAMMNRPDRSRILENINFPIQWIIGAEDTIASRNLVLKQAKLASINFVSLYNDCGHMSMEEQPGKLINDLLCFCKYCNS